MVNFCPKTYKPRKNGLWPERGLRPHVSFSLWTQLQNQSNLRPIDIITSTYLYWHVSAFFYLSPFQTSRTQPGSLHFFQQYENKTQLVIQNQLSESSYSMGDLRKQEKKYFLKFSLLCWDRNSVAQNLEISSLATCQNMQFFFSHELS